LRILYVYKATITDVYDGDTVTATIDLGFSVHTVQKLRLSGIDAPEMRGSERPRGIVSRDALRQAILNKEVLVKTAKDERGKYGRYLAEIYLLHGGTYKSVNQWMVDQGYAEPASYD